MCDDTCIAECNQCALSQAPLWGVMFSNLIKKEFKNQIPHTYKSQVSAFHLQSPTWFALMVRYLLCDEHFFCSLESPATHFVNVLGSGSEHITLFSLQLWLCYHALISALWQVSCCLLGDLFKPHSGGTAELWQLCGFRVPFPASQTSFPRREVSPSWPSLSVSHHSWLPWRHGAYLFQVKQRMLHCIHA